MCIRWMLALVLAMLAGCGPGMVSVSGEVKMDGVPLDKGVISFASADGKGTPATSPITNGRYELKIAPGKKKVQISAPKSLGQREGYDITEEQLPAKYHDKTELEYEVTSGSNSKNWEVQSIKGK